MESKDQGTGEQKIHGPPSHLTACSPSHLRLRAAVRVVFGRQVGDDEAVVSRAVNPGVADSSQGQLVDLPAVRTLRDVGNDGVGKT